MGTDFRLQADFLNHHKVRRLRARLGPDGVLAWLGLIGYAAANKPDGRLTGLDGEDIALVAGWVGEKDFTTTLVELRLLDHGKKTFSLHNWEKRQPWVMASEKRQQKARQAATARWGNRESPTAPRSSGDAATDAQSNATSMPDGCSEHAHSNAPTQPNLTIPNQKNGALFSEPQEGKSKPQKKPDVYKHWLDTILEPAFPRQGRCQQPSALNFLRKAKPTEAELDAYLKLAKQWAPVWIESGKYTGIHSFLTQDKYREPPSRSINGNGKSPAPLPPTLDELYGEKP
jgi:hypothetical protein